MYVNISVHLRRFGPKIVRLHGAINYYVTKYRNTGNGNSSGIAASRH